MRQLFCLGLGYSAAAYIHRYGQAFAKITGTVRSPGKLQRLSNAPAGPSPLTPILYEEPWTAAVTAAFAGASHVLVSAPPAHCAEAAAGVTGGTRKSVVYLSSIAVYGNYDGAEVEETSPLRGESERARERDAAERAWQKFGEQTGSPVAILRLAGIYGPGRNALVNVARGEARPIVKPNQVFNRIHVEDIAQAIQAAFDTKADGIFNLADDEPAPPQDVIFYAASLLKRPAPKAITFDQAKTTMSPMAQSFYADNKRIANRKIKTQLGLKLLYPDYRAGLTALHRAGDGVAESA
jgi:dTDP-4-dehydrorhamnose reductase